MANAEKVKEGGKHMASRKDHANPEEKVFQAWLGLTAEQRRSLGTMIRGYEWDKSQITREVTARPKRAPRPAQTLPLTGTEQ